MKQKARKLFGTDGIRGKVNTYPMTADMALKLGQAVAKYFNDKCGKEGCRIKAIIGKDTRISGYIFENALTAGLCSMGVDVYLLGPMPTPAIAHITKSFAADFGVVISASHNPSDDNGIKIFDSDGYKLPDEVELEIERMVLENDISAEDVNGTRVGKAFKVEDARGRYVEFVKNSVNNMKLKGLKIVLDCANGAAYNVAPMIFRELGAEVIVYNNKPDGLNINRECGSLHPELIKAVVLGEHADIGIALDGDADRVIMVDENGDDVDGDHIMAISALFMKKQGTLKNDTVVATVMSNLGFEKFMVANGINVMRAPVGDRYVIEEMKKGGHNLGGEQSGHIIFSDYSTTGDGTLTALQVMGIMIKTGKKLSELKRGMARYPQVMENVRVREKKRLETMKPVSEAIKTAEGKLGSFGRIIVRFSGTENKCRVMVEGRDEKDIRRHAKSIAKAIEKEIGE